MKVIKVLFNKTESGEFSLPHDSFSESEKLTLATILQTSTQQLPDLNKDTLPNILKMVLDHTNNIEIKVSNYDILQDCKRIMHKIDYFLFSNNIYTNPNFPGGLSLSLKYALFLRQIDNKLEKISILKNEI